MHWRNRCALTVNPIDERQKVAHIYVTAFVLLETRVMSNEFIHNNYKHKSYDVELTYTENMSSIKTGWNGRRQANKHDRKQVRPM